MTLTFDDLEPGNFQPTSVGGGLPKLVRIWEHLRDLNTGGYGGAVLVDVKDAISKGNKGVTSCSPFTGTCIYMALDPRPFNAAQPWSLKEPYEPVFDGGKPLDVNFYRLHNGFSLSSYASVKDKKFAGWKADFKKRYVERIPQLASDFSAFKFINHSAGSVVALNLGKRVDSKQMRRGDMVGIDWHNGNGHATFCWNVHLDKNGEVDCFQFISSNGTSANGGAGITIFRYPDVDPAYLEKSGGKYRKKKEMFSGILDDPRAYPEYIQKPYWWFGLPGVKKADIDLRTFGVPADTVQISYADSRDVSVHEVHLARLHGVTPPEPYLRADGGKKPEPREIAKPAPLTKVKAKKADEGAAKGGQAKTEPVKAPPGQPHPVQEELEGHLQTLWKTRWISKDPGDPNSVNDPESQAAIRDYQERYMKGDVPKLGHADPKTRARIAKAAASAAAMPMVNAALHLAHEHGEIRSAPGTDPMQLDSATREAVKDFQRKKGLDPDGIPGHDTQEKLSAYMKEAARSPQTKGAPPQDAKGGEQPARIRKCYFPRNHGPAGKPATLNLETTPACNGRTYSVNLLHGDKVVASGQVSIADSRGGLDLDVPNGIPPGSELVAKISGDLTAQTFAPFKVTERLVHLPLILAGPIVRRVEPEQVWFWFACREEVTDCTPTLVEYDTKGKQKGAIPLVEPVRHTVRLGQQLWVTLVSARPQAWAFPTDTFIGYDLAITYELSSRSVRVKLSDQGLKINYRPFSLPTFLIPQNNRRLVHGSCRRPGAPGQDAFGAFDQWLESTISDVAKRPSALLLTGDQIYADDVAYPLFNAVHQLAADVFGYAESLPRDGADPISVELYLPMYSEPLGIGAIQDRKALTSFGSSPIGFTTEDGQGHLLSFPEYAAMYLTVWNEQLCDQYHVDSPGPLDLYSKSVAAARRVLANMATYMVFDDHEITDDWNLDAVWENKTKSNAMARRIIANGLAAAWAFQAWGNDPAQFDSGFIDAIVGHLDEIRGAKGSPGSAAQAFDQTLLGKHWSFVAPTKPPVLCVDTRTKREHPVGKTVVLSGPKVWPYLKELSVKHKLDKEAPLLVVLPAPLLDHRNMLWGQHHKYPDPENSEDLYKGDYEQYPNNPVQRAELIRFIHDVLNPPSLVIFSGDVHHGFVIDGLYAQGASRQDVYDGKGEWAMRVVQVTSSAIKNVKKDLFVDKLNYTLYLTDAGNLGESIVPLYEVLYAPTSNLRRLDQSGRAVPISDGKTIAMRASAKKLTGALGRQTYVFENHLCVVDLPVRGGSVEVLFVGATFNDGTLATASTSVQTDNAPSSFDLLPWLLAQGVPLEVARPKAKPDEYGRF